MKLTPKQVIEKFKNLKSERSTWETHWQELYDYMLPNKADVIVRSQPGEKKNTHLFDNTAMQSAQLLAGALHGMLTSPNTLWFELSTGDQRIDNLDRVRFWLQNSTKRIYNILNNSNFNTEVHELYLDLVIIGTSPMSMEEDDEDIVRFNARPIGNVVVEEDHLGVVTTLLRDFKWNSSQLISNFGSDSLPQKVMEAHKKGQDNKWQVIHAVYRENLETPLVQFPFLGQYILVEEEVELDINGFRQFPYLVPRFAKIAGEKYGRSPGMTALPDAKVINKMDETVLIGAQKTVDPPMQAPDDGFVLPIITRPGGLNFYRAGSDDRLEPVFNDARIDFGFEAMAERRDRIRKAFYVDQLQLAQKDRQTATEVMQRTEESVRVLAPLLGRLRHEFLRPLIGRVIDIGLRRDLFDEIPPELRGRKLEVNYSSLIAKAQQVQEGQNILRAVEAIAPFASADPTVLDNIDGDAAVQTVARIYGMPQDLIRNQDQIQAIREQRAQAQEKEQSMVEQQVDSETVKNLAPTLKVVKGG